MPILTFFSFVFLTSITPFPFVCDVRDGQAVKEATNKAIAEAINIEAMEGIPTVDNRPTINAIKVSQSRQSRHTPRTKTKKPKKKTKKQNKSKPDQTFIHQYYDLLFIFNQELSIILASLIYPS